MIAVVRAFVSYVQKNEQGRRQSDREAHCIDDGVPALFLHIAQGQKEVIE
jgi:hypothetical protein